MKVFKNITLLLILVVILSFAILSVNATDADNNLNNIDNSAVTYNLDNTTSEFDDLTYGDDYSTTDDFKNNDTGNVKKDTLHPQDDMIPQTKHADDLDVIEKSNSQNKMNKVENLINVKNMINPNTYKLNQTSDNKYSLTLNN